MTQKQIEQQAMQKKNDWLIKLLALVCAVLLWFYAEAGENPLTDVQFDVPVQYINQSSDYVIEPAAQSVRVTVKGSEVELSGLRGNDFTATVDLRDAKVGTDTYKIEISSSASVDRISYQPMKTMLKIDQMATKEVPVRVRTTGTAAGNVELSSTEVQPNTVILSGLSSQLESVSDVETEAIDLSSIFGDTTVDTALHLPDGITVQGENNVQVHFAVQAEERHVNVAITPRYVSNGMTAELSRTSADVLVSGSAELLADNQMLNSLKLFVNCKGLTAGQYTLPVEIEHAGQLTVEQIRPQSVTVTISEHTPSGDLPEQDAPQDEQDNTTEEELVE